MRDQMAALKQFTERGRRAQGAIDKLTELRHCPWCGSRPTIEPWHGGGPRKRLVSCDNESCKVRPMVSGSTRERAIAAWNDRRG